MTTKKYELTDETRTIYNYTVHRIRALRDFGDIKAGDLGGWIEKEENLSHKGNAWVCENACILENACVSENAYIGDVAWIFGDAQICGNARVCGNACVSKKARVSENAHIYGNAYVCGTARVCGNARIFEEVRVRGNAHVFGNACICGNACVSDDAWIFGDARIRNYVHVFESAHVSDTCIDHGNIIWDVSSNRNIISIGPIGSRDDYTTFVNTKDGIMATTGCFSGTINEFEQAVNNTHENDEYGEQYHKAILFIKSVFG